MLSSLEGKLRETPGGPLCNYEVKGINRNPWNFPGKGNMVSCDLLSLNRDKDEDLQVTIRFKMDKKLSMENESKHIVENLIPTRIFSLDPQHFTPSIVENHFSLSHINCRTRPKYLIDDGSLTHVPKEADEDVHFPCPKWEHKTI